MILAAGKGTRLRPLTDTLPKPMVPLAGKPMLEYTIELLKTHGIRQIAMNLHHYPEMITGHFSRGEKWGVEILYSVEAELLGTAGAVKKLERFFTETFLVVYGDNLTTCDLSRLMSFHQDRRGVASIALHYREDPTMSGVVSVGPNDRIHRFLEKPEPGQVFSHWVNAGVLVLEPTILSHIPADRPSDFGRDVFPALLAAGQPLYGYRMPAHEGLWWIDTPEDLQRVQRQFEQGGIP